MAKLSNYNKLRDENRVVFRFGRALSKLIGKQNLLKMVDIGANIFEHLSGEIVSRGPLNDLLGSERSVEYFWVLRKLTIDTPNYKPRLLDIGPGPSLFPMLMASQDVEVWAIDLNDYKWKTTSMNFIQSDIRTADIPTNYFDWITVISVLEHVGFSQGQLVDTDADKEAVQSMVKCLNDRGKIIFTMPYGQEAVMRGWRVYDDARIEAVFTNLKIKQQLFFADNDGIMAPCSS